MLRRWRSRRPTGRRCRREIDGSDTPVVLSHSLASSAADLAPLAQAFASRGHRVLSFDQRGHGRSGPVGERPLTVDRLAQDVIDVLEACGAGGAIAVGHSSGGYSLLALGSQAQEWLSRIVVVGTSPLLTSAAERLTLRYARSPTLTRVQRFEPVGKAIVRIGSFGRRPSADAVEQAWRSVAGCPPATRAAFVDAMLTRPDVRTDAGELGVPLVVVRGSRDLVVARRRAAALAAVARDGRHVEVQGAGHMLPLEDPAAVVEAALA
jgi:pimeloyl-ACP methyl ester carboxylesterase